MVKFFQAGSNDGPPFPDDGDERPRGQPVGQLSPQPWLSSDDTKAVLAALTGQGQDVRFVGGCVRDAILGRVVQDIDIATPDPPERVMDLLRTVGLRVIPTGVEHGTVTAVAGNERFEITTLRRDVETFGRRARVAFTDDWLADASRRDFTFNALSATPEGMIYDPFDGLADLAAGRVRFVGDPLRRVDEDVLRILRFFRFYAHLGRPPADIEALAACRARAARLAELSGERIRDELIKILAASDPASILLLMQGEQVLPHILPEAADFGCLRQLAFLETRGLVRPFIGPDPLRRLAACLRPDSNEAPVLAERLRFSSRETHRLIAMAAPSERPGPDWDEKSARRFLYRAGADLFRDLLLLAWARRRAADAKTPAREIDRWQALLDAADAWAPCSLPVDGGDVIALGVPQGPAVGALLRELENWWIEGDFRAQRTDAIERLKVLMSGHG